MRLLTFLVAFILVVVSVAAQTPSASVVGRVTDATGAVVPGVSIKVTNLDTNISQPGSSNEVGDFTIPYLTPGRYSLEAQSPGFRAYKRSEFTLAVDQVLRLDISLEVGASTESVTVTAAPSVLNTDSGARGEVTTSEEIAEIPLEGRSFSDLAYLTGGVIPKGDGGDGSYAANGGRAGLLRCREVQAAPQPVRRHLLRSGLHPQVVQRTGPHLLHGHLGVAAIG